MTVGEKITFLRVRQNWTKTQLAEKIGVSEATIRNYEIDRGGLREKHLEKLAEIFGVDPSTLVEKQAESYNDVMQMLFMMADEYGLTTTDVDHVLPDDIVMVFNKRVMQNYLNAWHKKREQCEMVHDADALTQWELFFPLSLADDCQKAIKEERDKKDI